MTYKLSKHQFLKVFDGAGIKTVNQKLKQGASTEDIEKELDPIIARLEKEASNFRVGTNGKIIAPKKTYNS